MRFGWIYISRSLYIDMSRLCPDRMNFRAARPLEKRLVATFAPVLGLVLDSDLRSVHRQLR